MLPFHINAELFIVLYIAHKIGDYVFQTTKQALLKSKQWGPLLSHCFIYTGIVAGMAWIFTGYFRWIAVGLLFVSHVLLDQRSFEVWWAKTVKRIEDPKLPALQTTMIELDQSFHYIILFIISLIH